MRDKRNAPKLALRGAGLIQKRNVILSRMALYAPRLPLDFFRLFFIYAPIEQAAPEAIFVLLVLAMAGGAK